MLVGEKLNMSQQRTLAVQKANWILGLLKSSVTSMVKEVDFVTPNKPT